jgi:hypothetical protein
MASIEDSKEVQFSNGLSLFEDETESGIVKSSIHIYYPFSPFSVR